MDRDDTLQFLLVTYCADGVDPQGDLIMDKNGALYGVTEYSGQPPVNGGIVFKLTPPAAFVGGPWTETTLYTFCSQPYCADGNGPRKVCSLTTKVHSTERRYLAAAPKWPEVAERCSS